MVQTGNGYHTVKIDKHSSAFFAWLMLILEIAAPSSLARPPSRTYTLESMSMSKVIITETAEAYFLRSSKKTIKDLLMGPQMSLHRQQVRRRRQVLERIIDVMKLIGKTGLSHRGKQAEAAYTLDDDTIILLLLWNFHQWGLQHARPI